ncbi:MAG: efflux RND transporter periplasmic adaptor subunit [Terracidiphilus sp.]
MNQESSSNPHQAAGSYAAAAGQKPLAAHKVLAAAVVVLVILIVLGAVGIFERVHAHSVLAERTHDLAAPTVAVAPAKAGAPEDSFVLPGNVSAYTDAPINARTDGYLAHWYYDIGAHVKKGALLAVIDTPELDRQVAQADADLNTAKTNAGNAKVQSERYSGLVKSDAVSQFDTDTYNTQAATAASSVKSAEENLQRLKQLQSFEKVYAPFDGVVTARTIDTGQLINQGAGTELFHMQAIDTLRVYADVPEVSAVALKRGMKIDLTFPEHPRQTFIGTLVRTADAIDPASRTLLTEIDLDNRAGELMPGSLAQVHFKAPAVNRTFIVPSAALIFRREGLQVGTVVNGDTAHLVNVVIGEDDGATVQIVNGLNADDQVIQDPPDSLIDGEKVTVVQPGAATTAGGR